MPVFGDEQILRLQIAMNDAFLMGCRQPARDLHSVIDRLAHGHPATLDLLAQRFSLQQLRDQLRCAFIGSHLKHGKNIGMIQRRRRSRFLLEAPQSIGISREG